MYFRFYYFAILKHYMDGERIQAFTPWGQAILVIQLSVTPLSLLLVFVIRYLLYIYTQKDLIININIAGISSALIDIIVYLLCYKKFYGNDKSKKIYTEFIGNPLNTKRNRTICWVILVSVLFGSFVLIDILRPYVIVLK